MKLNFVFEKDKRPSVFCWLLKLDACDWGKASVGTSYFPKQATAVQTLVEVEKVFPIMWSRSTYSSSSVINLQGDNTLS